jgi:hypothetical protein
MFGKDFNPTTPGARGIGTAMLRIGTVLHAFTFDSRGENVAQSVYPINQHWAISTTTPATYTQVGQDLPYSNRFTLRGYATTGVTVDMATGNLVVIGRWGELLMRTTAGVNVGNEQWPGNLVFNGSQNTELPRGIALNTDTGAIALGDHDSASIDERRCAGAPFLNNVATTVRPSVGTFTVAAMTYVPTNNRAIPAGHGCNDSTGSVPCSYIASPPAPGNSRFAFTLMTKANLATLFVGTRLTMPFDFGPLGAPGCQAYVFPHAVHPVTTRISPASFAIGVPPGARKVSFLAQWLVFDPKANPLGLTLSDAREIIIP